VYNNRYLHQTAGIKEQCPFIHEPSGGW